MTSMMSRRVQSGMTLLDRNPDVPADWRALINVDELDMANGFRCVLAQLTYNLHWWAQNRWTDPYTEGLLRLMLKEGWPYGFDAREPDEYQALTREWKRRLSPDTESPTPAAISSTEVGLVSSVTEEGDQINA